MTAGCSNAVEIPRADYEAASHDEKTRYRVLMLDGTSHDVQHFSLTDSTIVMEKQYPRDFRHKQTTETIVLPRSNVESISKYELARGKSFLALSGSFLAIMFTIGLVSAFPAGT